MIGLMSSLVPDIDNRNSVVFKIFNVILGIALLIGSLLTYGFNLVALAVFAIIFCIWYFIVSQMIIPKHRQFIHSISAMLIWGLFVFIGSSSLEITLCALAGFYSHLMADLLFFKLW